MSVKKLLPRLLLIAILMMAGFFIARIFLSPIPPVPLAIVIPLGTDMKFDSTHFGYASGETHVPAPKPSVQGSAQKKINGHVIEVEAIVEGSTTELWEAYAWQQVGVEYSINGAPGASRLAKITYVLSYKAKTSATRDDNSNAVATYSGACITKETPANPIMIAPTNQPGRLPIVAGVPPNNSQFSEDAQNNVTITETAVPLTVGKNYISIIQAKAHVELTGNGSAGAYGMPDPLKMTLKQIKIEWM
jgi:hypothetical protein